MGSDHPLQSRGLNGSQWQVSFVGPEAVYQKLETDGETAAEAKH